MIEWSQLDVRGQLGHDESRTPPPGSGYGYRREEGAGSGSVARQAKRRSFTDFLAKFKT